MASTIRTVCPVGVYTVISDGNAYVTFTPSLLGGRMAMGASQPPPNHPHYRDCRGKEIELGNLVNTRIWWKPNEIEQAIETIVS